MKRGNSKPIKEVHFENIESKRADGVPNGSQTAEPRNSLFLQQFNTDFIPSEKLREFGAITPVMD